MTTDLIIYSAFIDTNYIDILELIEVWQLKVTKSLTDGCLKINTSEVDEKCVWRGTLVSVNQQDKSDIHDIYLDIMIVYENGKSPIKLSIFCRNPIYTTYMDMLVAEISSRFSFSDGSQSPDIKPWLLIPGEGQDRQLLEYWWQGKTVNEIHLKLHIEIQTIYNRIGILRKKWGEGIVPYRKKRR